MAGPSIGTWVKVRSKSGGTTPRVLAKKYGGGAYDQGEVITQSEYEKYKQNRASQRDSEFSDGTGGKATVSTARYRKGNQGLVVVQNNSRWQGELGRLAENLGGKYTHREKGYVLSPTATKRFRELAPLAKKQSFERTFAEEWYFRRDISGAGNRLKPNGKKTNEYMDDQRRWHRNAVEGALNSGKKVPARVLSEYPELRQS
jgi:hypothetical protein